MNVVLASFDPVPAPKGASQHILANAGILRRAGHDVSLVTLGDRPVPGLRHLPIDLPHRNWMARALAFHERVAAVFRRETFDAYHVRTPFEGLAVPADRPLLYEVNALYSIETQQHHPHLVEHPDVRRKLRRLELATLDRADVITTPSQVTAEYLADLGVEPDRIQRVPNAPSIPAIPRNPTDDGVTRLAYIGTLAPWQGLPTAVHVLTRLLHHDWTLTVRTASRHTRWLEKLVARRGLADRVRVLGPVHGPDLAAFLATQDIGLAPLAPDERNLVQGCMPIKLLDYLTAGLAIVAPDMPAVTDVLGDLPTYRRYSRTALTEMLDGLLGDAALRTALGEHSRVRSAAWSPEVQERALLTAYRSL